MGDSNVRVPPDSTGKKIDAASLDVGVDTVYRQRIVLADNAATQEFATVVGGILQVGGTVNLSATAAVSGTVNISGTVQVAIATPFTINNISATVNAVLGAGTSNIGSINNISRTVAAVLAAGTANIGTINNISAAVALAAGTANIGSINNVSATVNVAIATPFTVNNISATVNTVAVISAFLDGSGQSRNLVDSANLALRVNVVTGGGAGANPVSIAAGTSNIGFINNISATVVVAGTVALAAGAANIGTVNNISGTVAAVLGAGAANIGTINNISATVTAVLGAGSANIGTLNGISATVSVVLAAGTANVGRINDISATVTVSGNVNISATVTAVLGAGVANIGSVNNISATVMVAVAGYTPATMAIMSASHGPKCVTASTSANVTLVASPGAGLFVYVTQLMVGNNSSTKTLARIGTSASISTVVQPLAADGGGFVLNFDPPWKLSASEAAVCSVKPNVSQVYFTINFYVAS